MQITSPRREAAIRLFPRVAAGEMTITAAAAEVGVKRQTASEWFAKWKKVVAYAQENPGPDTARLKGSPAPADPAPVHEAPARESAQPAPLSLAERRAHARQMILDDLRSGVPVKLAVARAGFGRSTFYDILNRDPDYAAEVEAARSDYARDMILVVTDEAKNGRPGQRWLPAITSLERNWPEHFGRRANVAVDVEVKGRLDVKQVLSDPALVAQMSSLEASLQRELNAAPVVDADYTSLPEHE